MKRYILFVILLLLVFPITVDANGDGSDYWLCHEEAQFSDDLSANMTADGRLMVNNEDSSREIYRLMTSQGCLSWSYDGTMLALEIVGTNYRHIKIFDFTDGYGIQRRSNGDYNFIELGYHAKNPVWSDSANTLAYTVENTIYLWRPDQDDPVEIYSSSDFEVVIHKFVDMNVLEFYITYESGSYAWFGIMQLDLDNPRELHYVGNFVLPN